MCRLLNYLVEHTLSGASRPLSEYMLGVDVFDRNAAIYDTCDDPIVRVQVGRLREKLRQYFVLAGTTEPLRLSIPVGTYALLVEDLEASARACPLDLRLHCINDDAAAATFTSGVNEELAYYLQTGARAGQARAEGSLRIDADRVRIVVRLVEERSPRLLWTRQFDFPPEFSIAAQETIGRCLSAHLLQVMCAAQQSNLGCNGGVTDIRAAKNLKSDR